MRTTFIIRKVKPGLFSVTWDNSDDGSGGPPALYVLNEYDFEDGDSSANLYIHESALSKLLNSIRANSDIATVIY